MRHFALAAVAALVVAVVLVLVLAEEKVAEDTPPVATTQTGPRTVTDSVEAPARKPAPRRRERARVERAVALYIEAAERGELGSPGLPTSDELSFERMVIAGRVARVDLVGGARLRLQKTGERWIVVRAAVPTPQPNPPSNGS